MEKPRQKIWRNPLRENFDHQISGDTHRLNKAVIYLLAAIVASQFIFIFIGLAGEMTTNAMLNCTNEMRENSGLKPLYLNDRLNQAAKDKLADMKQYGYWAHANPTTGAKPWDFVDASGYYYMTTGENLAFGYTDSDKVCEAWHDSKTHYENIINDTYQEVGFAIERVQLVNGRGLLVVQMFGSRKNFTPQEIVVDEEQESTIIGEELVKGAYYEKTTGLFHPTVLKHILLFVIIGSYLTLKSIILYNKNRTLSINSSMIISAAMAVGSILIVFLYFYL